MVDESLKTKFDKGARSYDKKRMEVIPHLDQIYILMAKLANSEVSRPKILDLGAGTGLLTEHLLKRYSLGDFTLIDISEEMLNIARERFKDELNFKYINGNYVEYDFKGPFDMIISSLSIHHLENFDKKYLYSKIYENLKKGGIFLNADQVLAPNPENEDIYMKNWWEKIKTGSLTQDEKEIIIDRMKMDKPASLHYNIKWLKDCGFRNVDVFYKYYNFCILYGKK